MYWDTPEQFATMDRWTTDMLDLLDAHFAQQPYLLGAQPTLADFSAYVAGQQTNNSPVQDALAKSLEALKRLSAEDLDKLIS